MKKQIDTSLVIGYIGVSLVFLLLFSFASSKSGYAKFCSPDLQYSVTAKKDLFSLFTSVFPGQGGDASGKIYLYDEIKKKQIASAKINMVSRVSSLRWSGHTAYFFGEEYPTILDPWILPRGLTSARSDERGRRCND